MSMRLVLASLAESNNRFERKLLASLKNSLSRLARATGKAQVGAVGRVDVDGELVGRLVAEVELPGLLRVLDLALEGHGDLRRGEALVGEVLAGGLLLAALGLLHLLDEALDVEALDADALAALLEVPVAVVLHEHDFRPLLALFGGELDRHGVDLVRLHVGVGERRQDEALVRHAALVGEHEAEQPEHAEQEAAEEGSGRRFIYRFLDAGG